MIRLHGYWRASAPYRIRIALNLKGIAYEQVAHDLRTGAHRDAEYAALNPQRLVPALETPDGVLTQTLAMLEWLEEAHPAPPLLPATLRERAIVRSMAALIACDIHPLGNLRVLKMLREDYSADQNQVNAWVARWAGDGFVALERLVAQHGGAFAFGDAPTIADCCLVPQIYAAERFGVDMGQFPRLAAVNRAALALAPFATAHPDRQPDADPA